MIRLALRLALRGGRETATRLALIVAGVAVGVAVLLATLSLFNAFQATNDRPCWECGHGTAPSGWALDATADGALWNSHEDYYSGRRITRLDAAALGTRAPVVPGLPRMPAPGEYYASPALAALLDSEPREQLADRFPGTRAGLIARAGLAGPDELAVVVGMTPQQVAAMPGARQVDQAATETAVDGDADVYRFGFAVAAVGLIVPLLVLVGTATRLAAARRETRLAAIRLAGGTSRQTDVFAAVDAALGSLLGVLAGFLLFQPVRPLLAGVRITGSRFFPDLITPHLWQYAAVLACVPVLAVGAALWSLRRVRVSPLGAVKKAAPPPPRAWRMIPLLAGMVLFAGPVYRDGREIDALTAGAALTLVMVGLVLAGPWLTMRVARLAAGRTGNAATLLAARRMAADSRTAFRAVSGLVLAVFIGTALAGVVPAVLAGQQAVAEGRLNTVLRAEFVRPGVTGLAPQTQQELLARLREHPGTDVLPIYAKPETETAPLPGGPPPDPTVVECASLARFPVLGRCPEGAQAVGGNFGRLANADNPLTIGRMIPLAGPASPAASADGLALGAVLISTTDTATVERIRTLLAAHTAEAPMTFAEVAQVRATLYTQAQNIAMALVALTLLVGACSLVVAVGGGLVERRQPFTLLRLAGTRTRTLAGVVLLESALPLVLAAALAAAAGLGVAGPLVDQLDMDATASALPGPAYFATVGGGLTASLLLILTGVPLLRRMTDPDHARFE